MDVAISDANEKVGRRSQVILKFINIDSSARPKQSDKKGIRSHAAQGTGRPKRSLVLRQPRIGSWISDDRDSLKALDLVMPDLTVYRSLSMFPGVSGPAMNRIFMSFAQLSQAMYPTSFCSVFHIADSAWFMYLNQDPVNHYVYPYIAEAYFDAPDGSRAIRILSKILPLIQANLEDSTKAITDSTISAVLALASAADISGDLQSLRKHVHGLFSLVKLRGGIPQLRHSELQVKCCRVDIQLSLYTGSKPLFFRDDLSWDPYFTDTRKDAATSRDSNTDIPIPAAITSLNKRFRHIWTDAKEFCALVNLAHLTGRKIQPRLFQEIMVSLQYRLIHLEASTKSDDANMSRALVLSCLSFTTTIFLHVAGIPTRYGHLMREFENALAYNKQPEDQQLRLWMLMVAAISIFRQGHRSWLKTAMASTLTELELKQTSWQKIKSILKEFLWIDVLHDTEGRRAIQWSMCGDDENL